jgi:hypothetical protein
MKENQKAPILELEPLFHWMELNERNFIIKMAMNIDNIQCWTL